MLAKPLSRLTRSIFLRAPAPVRQRPERPAAADQRAPQGGWFESSYDLNRGIEVAELDWFDIAPPPGSPLGAQQAFGRYL